MSVRGCNCCGHGGREGVTGECERGVTGVVRVAGRV